MYFWYESVVPVNEEDVIELINGRRDGGKKYRNWICRMCLFKKTIILRVIFEFELSEAVFTIGILLESILFLPSRIGLLCSPC